MALLALFAAMVSVQAKGDDSVTHKVFFDVEIDGSPAGATVAAPLQCFHFNVITRRAGATLSVSSWLPTCAN